MYFGTADSVCRTLVPAIAHVLLPIFLRRHAHVFPEITGEMRMIIKSAIQRDGSYRIIARRQTLTGGPNAHIHNVLQRCNLKNPLKPSLELADR